MLDETVAKHAKVLIDFTEPGNCRYDDDNALGALSFFIDWTLRQEQHDACEEMPSEPHGPHPPSASSSISGPTTTTTSHAAFVNVVRTTATTPPLSYTTHMSSLLPWMNTLMQSGVVAAVARLLGSRAATPVVHPARTASTSTSSQTHSGGEAKQQSSAMVSREIQSEAMEFISCLMEGRSGNCLSELLDTSGLLVALLARLDAECKEGDDDDAAESQRSSQDGEVRESGEWCDDKSRSSSSDVHEASHCNRAKSETSHNNASNRNDRPQSYLPALHFTIRLLLILQDIFRAVSSATLVSRFGFIASSTLIHNLMQLALQSQSRQAMRVSGKWAAMQRQLCVQTLRLLQLLCTRHMTWLQCTEKEEQYEQDKWHYVEHALLCLLRESIEQEEQQDANNSMSSSLYCYHLQSAQAEVMMQALQTIQGMLIVRARRSSSRHNNRADTITTQCTITQCASLPWSRREARDGLVETIARLLRCQGMSGQDSVALCGVQTEALRVLQALLLALTEEHSRHVNSNTGDEDELMAWITRTTLMQTCVPRLRGTTSLLHSVAGHTHTTATLQSSQDQKCNAGVTGGCCRREVEVALRVVRFVYVLYTQLSCEASGRVSNFTKQHNASTMDDIHTVLVKCQLPSTLAAFVAAMHAAGQFAPCEALGVLDMVAPQHDMSIESITRNDYRTPSPQPTSTSSSLPITPQPSSSSSSSPQRPVRCNVIPCLPAARDTLVAEDAMTRLLLLPVHDAMQLLLEWLSRLQPTEQVDGTLQRERAACRTCLIPYVTAFLASCLGVSERGCLPSCLIARLVTCMRVLRLSWAEEDDSYSNRVMSVQCTQLRQLRLLLLSVASEQGCHIANTETEQRHIVQEALDLMHTIVSHRENPYISEDRNNAWQEVQAVERLLRWHCVSCLSNAERVAVQHMSTLWQAQRTTTTTNTIQGYGDTSDLCVKGCERLVHDLCACAVPFASSADEANGNGDAVDDMRSRPCDDTWQKYDCHNSNKVAVGRSICDLTACETGLLAYGSRLPRVLRLLYTLLCCGEWNAGLYTATVRMEWFMSGAGCLLCALVHHCSAWLVHSTATRNYHSEDNIRSSGYISLQSMQYNELPQSLLRLPETPFAAHDCSSSGDSNSERHQRGTQNSKASAAVCDTDDVTYCVAWLFATAVRLLAMLLQPSYSKAVTNTRSIRVGLQRHSSATIHKHDSAIERCMRMAWHDAQEKTLFKSNDDGNDEAALVCARELTRCWLRNTPWLPLEDSLLVKRCRADEVTELRQAVSFVRELVTP